MKDLICENCHWNDEERLRSGDLFCVGNASDKCGRDNNYLSYEPKREYIDSLRGKHK